MTKKTRNFYLAPICGAFLYVWMASAVAAECGYFKPLGDLTAQMRSLVTGQTPQGAASARRVARHVQAVDSREVGQQLLEINRFTQVQHVEQLVATAEAYSRTMHLTNTVALVRNIQYLEGLFELVCGSQQEDQAIRGGLGSSRIGHLTALIEDMRGFFKVCLLVIFLAGVVGLLFSLRYVVLLIVGFVHHKKFCRIPAQLRGDSQLFKGKVTRAGLNGVRFEFETDAEAKRLTDLTASPGFVYFDLLIDDQHWPVFVDRFQKFFVPLYFLERLKQDELKKLLTKSTRATHSAPAIGHPSNRRVWRAQIKKRKAEIKNVTRHRSTSG